MNPLFHTDLSISDSLKNVRKSVLIYETIIENDMEVKKIADILLNMSLGIDYRDDIEDRDDYDEAVMNLKR